MELNDDASSGLEATVPAKALQELQRLLVAHPESSIQIQTDPSQITFECGSQRLVSRLLEGTYPNYEQLLPRQFTHQVTVDRRSFLSALERISVLADQKNNIVRFVSDPEAQTMILSVDAQDVGNGRETISAQISGEELQIAFNIKYIVEGLRAISTPEVQMQFNTSTAPAVIGPHGGPKHRYLVMPVQLRAG
jgi:DNA polymerase-3 subunit beta